MPDPKVHRTAASSAGAPLSASGSARAQRLQDSENVNARTWWYHPAGTYSMSPGLTTHPRITLLAHLLLRLRWFLLAYHRIIPL